MIAVTGANGLLGSYVVRALHAKREPFVAIKRRDSDIAHLKELSDFIRWRDADITDSVALEKALQDVTGIIHTAGMVSFNPRNANKVFKINTEGTRTLINAALTCGVKRFLHVSSVAALGRQKDQTLIDENNKWNENPLNSYYAQSKYNAELEVFRGQEEGLSTVIVNPSVILGFSDWNKSSSQLFKYAWQQKPFYMDGSLNYVDVTDVVNISLKLFNSPIENERFIVSAGSIPFKDFFEAVARRFGGKGPSIKVRGAFLAPLAALESARTWLTGTEPIITRETARLAGTHFNYDAKKIKKTLDFDFQTFDNTVAWCCGLYRDLYTAKNH